jgi:glycosyltransferase involved in cell wall biosynthesis
VKISIVTPSFNQGQFIERTIQSIVEQRGEFELEYFVQDGGSTDQTLEILERYEGKLSWTSERDDGQVDAINKGLRACSGDVLAWVNSDDVLRPGALQRVAEAFSDPATQWLHGRCDIIDENDRTIRPLISAYKHWCCSRYSYSRLLTENFVSQMTVFWRRSLMSEVGVLDQNLDFAFDYDLWLRFAKLSDPTYIRESLASFRWYRSSKSGSLYRKQFAEDYLVAERHAPALRRTLMLKRFRTIRLLTAYNLMRLFESTAGLKPNV